MIELFTMTGGLRTEQVGAAFPFNMGNVSWPFAHLAASRQRLTIQVFSTKYTIEKDQIRQLSRHRGLWSVGLRIVHTNPTIPPGLIFWTFNFKRLQLNLESLGYRVDS